MPNSPFDAKQLEAKLWIVPLEERRRIAKKARARYRKARLEREREAAAACKAWLREARAKDKDNPIELLARAQRHKAGV
jgi:hypothetical protein